MAPDLLRNVVAAEHLGGQRLRLRFDDGVEGEVDLRRILPGLPGLLQALEDAAYVARVTVTDHGTIEWPNGVELDPIVVYCAAKGIPVPDFEAQVKTAKRPGGRGHRGGGKRGSSEKRGPGRAAR